MAEVGQLNTETVKVQVEKLHEGANLGTIREVNRGIAGTPLEEMMVPFGNFLVDRINNYIGPANLGDAIAVAVNVTAENICRNAPEGTFGMSTQQLTEYADGMKQIRAAALEGDPELNGDADGIELRVDIEGAVDTYQTEFGPYMNPEGSQKLRELLAKQATVVG